MKFTLSWLKDYLDTPAPLDRIVDALNNIGLEVESVEDPSQLYTPFSVAKIIKAEPHPDADKLQICTVETKDGTKSIVCGAKNARADLTVIYAPIGAHIPANGMVLKKTKIRGIESEGMLCSERELMLGNDHEGIAELSSDHSIGTSISEIFNKNDPVIEIAITPNRADALGVYGIARDLAAYDMGEVKPLPEAVLENQAVNTQKIRIELDQDKIHWCPAFSWITLSNVNNTSTTNWMKARLEAIGEKSISPLVDLTNFMTFDLNRPLHVFDADKVKGDLVVRAAKNGEVFLGLDGKTYELNDTMCVIADDNGVQSLAGIMGGSATSVTPETKNVIIESALWDPLNIARTGRNLGIITHARYRFERDVDPAFMVEGLKIAAAMALHLVGGSMSELATVGTPPLRENLVVFPFSEIKRLSGIDIEPFRAEHILKRLGFHVVNPSSTWRISVPSYRNDVTNKADIVEEILRIYGMSDVPTVPLPQNEQKVSDKTQPTILSNGLISKKVLAFRGFKEIVSWSFSSKKRCDEFARDSAFGTFKPVAIKNPISEDLSHMRTSCLINLLFTLGQNLRHGQKHVALMEVGPVFTGVTPSDQHLVSAGVRTGHASLSKTGRHWQADANEVSVFDIKSDCYAVLASTGVNVNRIKTSTENLPDWAHPGRSAWVMLGNVKLAIFAECHPEILKTYGIKQKVMGFEVFHTNIPAKKRKTTTKPALPEQILNPVLRDFAFLVPAGEKIEDVKSAIQNAHPSISTTRVFDIFEQKEPQGSRSVAFEVSISQDQETLKDDDIAEISGKVINAALKHKATLRV